MTNTIFEHSLKSLVALVQEGKKYLFQTGLEQLCLMSPFKTASPQPLRKKYDKRGIPSKITSLANP